MNWSRPDFPEGFAFGAATSAYQIEGHAQGGAGRCHWDDFAQTPGNVAGGHDGARACDHLHHLEQDLDLLAALGVDAYRFSLSWARVLPEGRGTVNAAGLDFYDRLVDGLLARGIAPFATLYHWELPSALADLGGWRNRDIAHWFADYAQIICNRLGDRLASVATINEPWCVSWLSHFEGHHAPGLRDIRATARAMHHILLAHGQAVTAMRAMGQKELGLVCNMEFATPASARPEDQAAAARHDAIYNRFFFEGVIDKSYPQEVLAGLEPHLPKGWTQDFDVIGAPVDWVGLNYYTRRVIKASEGPWPALESRTGSLPQTDMGWEIYPEGLGHFLRRIHAAAPDLPIHVTENGMASANPIHDADRIAYLDAHLAELRRAIAEGIPIKSYFIWSLMDNFEWAFGYDKRFGLVHVDFDTLERRPKDSFHALARALRL